MKHMPRLLVPLILAAGTLAVIWHAIGAMLPT